MLLTTGILFGVGAVLSLVVRLPIFAAVLVVVLGATALSHLALGRGLGTGSWIFDVLLVLLSFQVGYGAGVLLQAVAKSICSPHRRSPAQVGHLGPERKRGSSDNM